MGIRVHVGTEDTDILEKLAGVEPGTSQRLKNLCLQKAYTRKGVNYYLVPGTNVPQPLPRDEEERLQWFSDMQDRERDAIWSDNNLYRLHTFQLFGFGRLSLAASDYLWSIGFRDEDCQMWHAPYGRVIYTKHMYELLRRQNIPDTNFYHTADGKYWIERYLPDRPDSINFIFEVSELKAVYWS